MTITTQGDIFRTDRELVEFALKYDKPGDFRVDARQCEDGWWAIWDGRASQLEEWAGTTALTEDDAWANAKQIIDNKGFSEFIGNDNMSLETVESLTDWIEQIKDDEDAFDSLNQVRKLLKDLSTAVTI